MHHATICFLMDKKEHKVLLGMKKRGFGAGKYNGYGGKVEDGESYQVAAARELQEESGVIVLPDHLVKHAELHFTFPKKKDWDQIVHVFVAERWEGIAIETDEMKPYWTLFHTIPYDQMWQADKHWLPLVLQEKKIKAYIPFAEDNESMARIQLTSISAFGK